MRTYHQYLLGTVRDGTGTDARNRFQASLGGTVGADSQSKADNKNLESSMITDKLLKKSGTPSLPLLSADHIYVVLFK